MPNRTEKQKNKEQDKTQHETPHNKNYRATQNNTKNSRNCPKIWSMVLQYTYADWMENCDDPVQIAPSDVYPDQCAQIFRIITIL